MAPLSLLLQAWPALLAAGLLALVLAWMGRARPWLAGLAAGLGALAGWWWLLGLPPASPRQLAERLPLLLAMLLALAGLAAPLLRGRARLGPALVLGGALLGGWWMAGAPRPLPDLWQALPAWLLGAGLIGLLARGLSPGRAPFAAAALLAGLLAGGLPGPQVAMATILLAASLGACRAAAPPSALFALPLAGALGGLALLPILARGGALDWLAGVAMLLVLRPWSAPRARP
jgi:hypothetical protein